jgi:hypothetical protein
MHVNVKRGGEDRGKGKIAIVYVGKEYRKH